MKNFFKKLAFVLALAMVVATVAPAAKASAAAAPKLNTASKKLYLGGDVTGKYSDTVDLNVKNKGNNNVTFSTKDAKIATVDAKTGVVTAKSVGYVEVVAKLTDKTTKKTTTTLTAKIWVKQNADGFGLGSLAKFDNALTVGTKVKVNAYRALDGKKIWKQADKTVVTDYVKWTSSDASVAKVDKWGTVTAVAPGEATITAYAAQTEGSTKTTDAKTVTVKVAAANGIKEVVQVSENEAVVYFNGTPEVTKETLVIKDSYGQEFLFDEFDFNKDNNAAAVKTIENFTDGMVYTVSVKGIDKAYDFTASVGKVAKIKITGPSSVVAYENTKLEYAVYDKNGIDVTGAKVNEGVVEFTVADADASNAYITDKEVYFYEVGKTAKVTVTYHTNEIDAQGNEIVYTDSYTFKSLDPSAVTLNYANVTYKIKNGAPDFADGTIGMSITSAADYPVIDMSNAQGKSIYAMLKVNNLYYSNDVNNTGVDLNGNTVGGVTFESLDEAKLQVDATGGLTLSATGVAKIKIITDYNERSVIVPVMVLADPYPVSFSFDKQTITNLSNVGNAANDVQIAVDKAGSVTEDAVGYSATFTATIKDQNGDFLSLDNTNYEVEALNDLAEGYTGTISTGNSKNNTSTYLGTNNFADKISFTTNGQDAGTYKFKVTISGTKPDGNSVSLYRTIQFTVVDAGAPTDKFQIVADTDSKDIKVTTSSNDDLGVYYKLVRLDSKGMKLSYVDESMFSIKIKAPNGVAVEVDNSETKALADITATFVPTYAVSGTSIDAKTGANTVANVGYSSATSKAPIGYKDANLYGVALRLVDGNNVVTKAKTGTYTVSVYAEPTAYAVNGTSSSDAKLIGTKALKVSDSQPVPSFTLGSTTLKTGNKASDIVVALKKEWGGTFSRIEGNFNRIDLAPAMINLEAAVVSKVVDNTSSTNYTLARIVLSEIFGANTVEHVITFNKTVTVK